MRRFDPTARVLGGVAALIFACVATGIGEQTEDTTEARQQPRASGEAHEHVLSSSINGTDYLLLVSLLEFKFEVQRARAS